MIKAVRGSVEHWVGTRAVAQPAACTPWELVRCKAQASAGAAEAARDGSAGMRRLPLPWPLPAAAAGPPTHVTAALLGLVDVGAGLSAKHTSPGLLSRKGTQSVRRGVTAGSEKYEWKYRVRCWPGFQGTACLKVT